jgi:endonuclease III
MATPNRSALLTKTHKVLKKHYKPAPPTAERTVLENLLYACCLENTSYEAAEQALAAISATFFDWNEIRVSMVKELAEVMHHLSDPTTAAGNLKRTLQAVFESTYSFDLEAMKKQNLGQAIQKLKKLDGTTPFTIAFVTQASLAGHAIPVDRGTLECMLVVGAVSEAEMAEGTIPGLERAIPKSKGSEFGSLLHQLGAEYIANPLSPNLHKILLEINSDCKDRLPKKQPKVRPPEPEPAPVAKHAPAKPAAAEKAESKKADAKSDGKKSHEDGKKSHEKAPANSKTAAKESHAAKKEPASSKKAASPPPRKSKAAEPPKKSSSAGLSKRKPR